MTRFTLSKIVERDFVTLVRLKPHKIADYNWTEVESLSLNAQEKQELEALKQKIFYCDTHSLNEATIWARAIYPMLVIAERGDIQAWAGVEMYAKYPKFELEGIADGALARSVSGRVQTPYLIVVEAKRGIENQDPLYQLYAQLLAAAHLNWEKSPQEKVEIFGCYTIADSWKFVRAEVSDFESDLPLMQVEPSREYTEKLESDTIYKILRLIVSKYLD
jgi:hypothetical protein